MRGSPFLIKACMHGAPGSAPRAWQGPSPVEAPAGPALPMTSPCSSPCLGSPKTQQPAHLLPSSPDPFLLSLSRHMQQITSSAIGNKPPPSLVVKLVCKGAEQVKKLDKVGISAGCRVWRGWLAEESGQGQQRSLGVRSARSVALEVERDTLALSTDTSTGLRRPNTHVRARTLTHTHAHANMQPCAYTHALSTLTQHAPSPHPR